MNRLKFLFLAALIALPFAAHADTVGPITMNGAPLGDGDMAGSRIVYDNYQTYFEVNPYQSTYSENISFSFDIAAGWSINTISLTGSVGGGDIFTTPGSPSGLEFFEVLTLCSTDDVCTTGSRNLSYGNASMPTLPGAPQVAAGTGMLQIYAYADNTDFYIDPGQQTIMLNLSQTSPVPEPASIALFGSGALGLLAAARRRLALR